MNAKAYNVNALVVRDSADHQPPLRVWGTRKEMVIIEGPGGYVATCSEGVHYILRTVNGAVPIDCEPIPEEGTDAESFRVCPSHGTELPVGAIMQAPSRDVNLGDFVRRFGDRLERNYSQLLRSLKQIGLDPADYPRD